MGKIPRATFSIAASKKLASRRSASQPQSGPERHGE
jgi:hypothetical protein